MYLNLSATTKAARSQALNESIGANATLVIYDGIYPASPDFSTSANALVSFTCNSTNFGNVVVNYPNAGSNTVANTAVVTLTSLPFQPVLSMGNGYASWGRISTANGIAILDLDVGTSNSIITINSNYLIANIPVQVVSINLSEQ